MTHHKFTLLLIMATLILSSCQNHKQLESWQQTSKASQDITNFVERVTTPGSADFIPEKNRIAVFDNDGTLWAEKPIYFQLQFVIDRVKTLAPKNPQWKNQQPFQAVLENDMKTLKKGGHHAIQTLLLETHAHNTPDEFREIVRNWLATAKHPTTGRHYTEMVYQPMLEVLQYLRENGFKTFIVSGGGIEFIRAWAEEVYDIPPHQVVGSSIVSEFTMVDGHSKLIRKPKVNFIDDKAAKPVAIQQHIGQRPTMAFGNSDGDLQMIQWTTDGQGPRFGAIVHHTDAQREWQYDRKSSVGRLNKAMDQAKAKGWSLIDMKNEWKVIFPAK